MEEGATACPECGSDERTGWSENTLYDGLDLPEEAFDQDQPESGSNPCRNNLMLLVVGSILLLIFVYRFVLGL